MGKIILDLCGGTGSWSKPYKEEVLKQIKQGKHISPLKLIRLKCLECCTFNEGEVRHCGIEDCILHKYRFGKNPVKRIMSEKQKENLKKMLKANKKPTLK